MTLLRGVFLGIAISTLCAALSPAASADDAAKSPGHRLLVGDYSTKRLAIVEPDGTLSWETPIHDIHDAALLPNGNILFQQGWTKIVEMSPDHKIVWQYDAGADAPHGKIEVHAFQRLADGCTMIAESGPGRIIEVDRDGKIVATVKLKLAEPNPHRDTRLVRKLDSGHYLVAHEGENAVREYDPQGTVVWEYKIGKKVYSALRLASGNTLIGTGDGHSVIEVDPAGKIVWEVKEHDLPGITLAWITMVDRLPNGNTIIVNCHAGPANPQVIEVTPDKKVVWTFKDFKKFGNATAVARVLPADAAPKKPAASDGAQSQPSSHSPGLRPGAAPLTRPPDSKTATGNGPLKPIPDRLVVLTFDDGNKSDIETVAPALKKFGFGATFFITEGLGAAKDKKNFLTWDEVQRLDALGFEIGNHTGRHDNPTTQTREAFNNDVATIEKRCAEHGIPRPMTFCYPGYAHDLKSVEVLRERGYLFARRGMYPELKYVEGGGRGFAYDPKEDHPLLIPFTATAGPQMRFADLVWAVDQARDGKICVLTLHGVPAKLHSWVSTTPEQLDQYLRYLKEKNCTVIALRDLAEYVDPEQAASDPYAGVNRRMAAMKEMAKSVARP
ncbi:MAG: polysaccharide deacetylase family protein [Planctomycetia bacterium]|nr:polysaccharide deacetylase family protein [Planctomycetia bacterium]